MQLIIYWNSNEMLMRTVPSWFPKVRLHMGVLNLWSVNSHLVSLSVFVPSPTQIIGNADTAQLCHRFDSPVMVTLYSYKQTESVSYFVESR